MPHRTHRRHPPTANASASVGSHARASFRSPSLPRSAAHFAASNPATVRPAVLDWLWRHGVDMHSTTASVRHTCAGIADFDPFG